MIIYKTINKINNIFYIGKDMKENPNYLGSGIKLKRAIKKYGKENFQKIILEHCNNLSELNDREKYWIKKLEAIKYGYNIAEGGTGGDTLKGKSNEELNEVKRNHSISAKNYWNNLTENEKKEKTKNYGANKGDKNPKLSEQRKKEGNPMFGKHMYKIWIDKYGIDEANNKMIIWKNKMNTDDRKNKISVKMKNRIVSSETRGKLSKSKKERESNIKGRIWINKENKNKMILKNELSIYFNNGWKCGRFKK